MAALLSTGGVRVDRVDGALHVFGPDAAEIGEVAFRNNVLLHELAPHTGSLEEAFLQATADSQEFRSDASVAAGAASAPAPGQLPAPAAEGLPAPAAPPSMPPPAPPAGGGG